MIPPRREFPYFGFRERPFTARWKREREATQSPYVNVVVSAGSVSNEENRKERKSVKTADGDVMISGNRVGVCGYGAVDKRRYTAARVTVAGRREAAADEKRRRSADTALSPCRRSAAHFFFFP